MASRKGTTMSNSTQQGPDAQNGATAQPDNESQQAAPPAVAATPLPPGAPRVLVAIAAIVADLGTSGIAKNREVTEGARFKFRGIDDVMQALNPLLARHNLLIIPRITNRRDYERKTTTGKALFSVTVDAAFDFVSVEDGSCRTVETVGEAMDSGDKATNKAMSIAYKYACILAFCIPVIGSEGDPDETVHDVAGREDFDQRPQQERQPPQQQRQTSQKRENPPPATKGAARMAEPTPEQSKAEYNRVMDLLEMAPSMAEMQKGWESANWALIPKGWLPHLQNAQKKAVADLQRGEAPPPRSSAPAFDGPASDDIPFD